MLFNYKICLKCTAFLLLLTIYSCRTMKKETIKPQHTVEKEVDKNLLNNIINNNVSFENIAIRFNASVTTNKQNQNLKGNLVVKKDSIIWISITPIMGIEIFRIIITQDSVKFVNK